jgi:sodium transport system ATP-binding protein
LNARIDEALATLGLEDLADRRTAGFSQGERMKTALARAILHRPPNLLLDEPTNGLDIAAVRSLRGLLVRFRAAGLCIVLSSHVLEEVRMLCDHLVILRRGEVADRGTPAAICAEAGTASLAEAFLAVTAAREAIVCSTRR